MSADRPRRVIWITSDHMRYDCVGAYGNAAVHTPALDALAGGGVNFSNCFVQNPLCMPSRASFMTGLYPQQCQVPRNGYCLPGDFQPVAASVFKAAGYRPAHIGKLHLQPHEDHDLRGDPDLLYGFEFFERAESRGCYEDAYVKWLRNEHPRLVEAFHTPRPTARGRAASEKDGWVVEAPWECSHSGWVVEAAERFLGKRAGEPVFLHLGFHNPHPPLNPTRAAFAPYERAEVPPRRAGREEWGDKPEPLRTMMQNRSDWTEADFVGYRRYFYALVTEMDLAIGRLMEVLGELGGLEETLIVFSSDHGDMCGDHGLTHKGPHFFDEVMRVPLILHWPAGLGGGRREVGGLVEMVDLLPTLLGLCGAGVPEEMAGRSWAGELLAGASPAGREDVFAYHDPDWAMLRTDRWKYICYQSPAGGEVLYDLAADPPEVVNLAADGNCGAVLGRMRRAMLGRCLQACRSPLRRRHPY